MHSDLVLRKFEGIQFWKVGDKSSNFLRKKKWRRRFEGPLGGNSGAPLWTKWVYVPSSPTLVPAGPDPKDALVVVLTRVRERKSTSSSGVDGTGYSIPEGCGGAGRYRRVFPPERSTCFASCGRVTEFVTATVLSGWTARLHCNGDTLRQTDCAIFRIAVAVRAADTAAKIYCRRRGAAGPYGAADGRGVGTWVGEVAAGGENRRAGHEKTFRFYCLSFHCPMFRGIRSEPIHGPVTVRNSTPSTHFGRSVIFHRRRRMTRSLA